MQRVFELSKNPLVGLGDESGGVFSEVLNFESPARELGPPASGDWYGQRQEVGLGPLRVDDKDEENVNNNNDADRLSDAPHHHQHQQISRINGDSSTAVAAMQLFLFNPTQNNSSIPPPHQTTSYMLPFGTSQFSPWPNQENICAGFFEGKGLSLSLSSSKAEEFRMGDGDNSNNGMLYFNQETNGGSGSSNSAMHIGFKNLGAHYQQESTHLNQQQQQLGIVNILRNSRYSKVTQELLEEFCNVGRENPMMKKKRLTRQDTNPDVGATCSKNQNAPTPLSSADRIEHQRRKLKLLSMLDEVDRRYTEYCEQMQRVVNSFELVMGYEAAIPYTSLAQKAMSRHFRCLKEALTTQLKHSYEVLGEKDGCATSGLTKGETPRLKLLEQRLRQQRGFYQMGMVEQEAWRPQRGLPERSVNVLRAWLFEHFLHPYPSDADKHLLARQTGLSRNQVSNWFINARVRLWKPMVEEMYQQESKEHIGEESERNSGDAKASATRNTTATTTTITTTTPTAVVDLSTSRRSELNEFENDHSFDAINRQCFLGNQSKQQQPIIHYFPTTMPSPLTSPIPSTTITTTMPSLMQAFPPGYDDPHGSILGADFGVATTTHDVGCTFIKFGTSPSNVSLTLGLSHTGDLQDNNQFSVTDFGSC